MYRDHRPRTPRTPRTRKTTVRMDPDCAICHAPASMACDCEAKGLDVAIKQAEQRMMQSIYNDIRSWVRAHAQDYILEYFRLLTERRKASHAANLDRINATAYHYYHAPPHPSELAQAQADLKRGIDEDWQSSVQRYPEVLEYFFSLVDLTVPPDDDPIVKDPPLSALSGSRKSSGRRLAGGGPQPPGRPQAITAPSGHDRDPFARRTPPPIEPPSRMDRRTPGLGGRDRRSMPPMGHPGPPPGPFGRTAPPAPQGYYPWGP
ncbi:serine threonine protein phosphatase [Colletotrichum tofieldiae]|uniref:Serine threonine protein phosphatase n=1 Tax=Colletotrichum tofieldiae TaxID=708197 RepID=A0A166VT95_9PEZI|nr:serine threonine protein phosphatase [Colletotrichum tofieldiae]GKT59279.1 serine threonine protein phosphatase [Colletotrichum tofieldiae]GKT80007.1 serine threonine protein phosphatase [Colletotrichum tofieldiae]